MQIFRKHSKGILWALVIFIGAPMLFFGLPTCRTPRNGGPDPIVASVGDVPVPASQYRRLLDLAARRAARNNERPTYKEMVDSGLAENVLDEALDSARLSIIEQQRGLAVNEPYLWERMKRWKIFLDDNDNFNPKAWNDWLQAQKERDADFNAIYADVMAEVSRGVLLKVVMAPGNRVFDEDIDRDLEENYTKLKVKFAKVDVKVEPTEEEIRKQYDENPDRYKYHDKHIAEFVRIDLTAPHTQETLDLVKQLREGGDFAALADEHSDLSVKNGGDMGWQFPRENEAEYRKPLFDLAVGAISDPVPGPSGYYIYKVEEERMNEDTGDREVKARQIYIKTDLAPEEKQAKQELADAMVSTANDKKSLAEGVEEKFDILRTDWFDIESEAIDNVLPGDVRAFRGAFRTVQEDAPYQKIVTSGSIYVAGVVETEKGKVKPYEEVKEAAREDAIAAFKRTDEYREQVEALANKIKDSGKKLDEIAGAFPEFDGEVKETQDFTKKDYLYQQGLFVATPDIFEAFRGKEPGHVAGPLSGFIGDSYFIELEQRTPPTDEDKQRWPEEREQMRLRAMQMAQMELMQDYLVDLRTNNEFPANYNNKVISEILGTGKDEEEGAPAGKTEADSAPEVPAKS